jgi:hypothetical protein
MPGHRFGPILQRACVEILRLSIIYDTLNIARKRAFVDYASRLFKAILATVKICANPCNLRMMNLRSRLMNDLGLRGPANSGDGMKLQG